MHSLVLIEKISSICDCWTNLIKKNKLPELSVEAVVNCYQGFEGELILFYSVKEVKSEIKKIIEQYLELKSLGNCLLLYVISCSDIGPLFLKDQMVFSGYDVGVCEEEKTIYSSVFNEILFGNIAELVAFKCHLNVGLLFPTYSLANNYVDIHNEMSAQGRDVEDYEEMIIYEIWRYKD